MTLADGLKVLIDLAALLMSLVALGYAYVRTRQRESSEEMRAVETRVAALEATAQRFAARLEAVPSTHDLTELKVALANLHGDLKAIAANTAAQTNMIERLAKALDMHEEHLLKGASR